MSKNILMVNHNTIGELITYAARLISLCNVGIIQDNHKNTETYTYSMDALSTSDITEIVGE